VIEGLILAMLGEASRRQNANNDRPRPPWLKKAHAILTERFTDNLTLADIAAEVGVHPVTLAAKFRESYGHTVGEFVRQSRIERARVELSKGNLSLASIAATAGFADQSHFSKAFKSYTGMTPTEYRRELADS
jgi:AraC family transcriptional regulator